MRYVMIELEMLAVSWALTKCRLYLKGLPTFTLQTDHHPLVPIINSYTLDMVKNPQLQRMNEHMSQYQFTAVWHTGNSLCIPDAFSSASVSYPTSEDMTGCAEVTAHTRSVISAATASQDKDAPTIEANQTLQDMPIAVQADPTYVRLRDCISSRFPTNRLHDSHQGVEATKRWARQTVFWPGIDSDIANTNATCKPCQVLCPSQQQEPLHNDDHPSRPFESVSADFFQVAGKSFLVVADCLSGWPVVVPCKGDTTTSSTIRHFCCYFREVGVTLLLRTDGRTPATSKELADFT
ncbi:uncharacterized protein [Macrobrachium rosenbergii]|uniref:uncharacterized protein n=1 Tax=Macrobrachium rosenbergii TaxID=79674 RepID=UPI0034D51461